MADIKFVDKHTEQTVMLDSAKDFELFFSPEKAAALRKEVELTWANWDAYITAHPEAKPPFVMSHDYFNNMDTYYPKLSDDGKPGVIAGIVLLQPQPGGPPKPMREIAVGTERMGQAQLFVLANEMATKPLKGRSPGFEKAFLDIAPGLMGAKYGPDSPERQAYIQLNHDTVRLSVAEMNYVAWLIENKKTLGEKASTTEATPEKEKPKLPTGAMPVSKPAGTGMLDLNAPKLNEEMLRLLEPGSLKILHETPAELALNLPKLGKDENHFAKKDDKLASVG